MALSNIKPDGEAKIRCSEALTRGNLKNKKREKARHKEHPALKKLVVGILCAVLCVSVAAGVFLLVNRGKIPLPPSETNAPEQSAPEEPRVPEDAVGLSPCDAGSGALRQIILLQQTLAFDYMKDTSFNTSYDPSSAAEIVAYDKDGLTDYQLAENVDDKYLYAGDIFDCHFASDTSQKLNTLFTHLAFASDARLISRGKDDGSEAFSFPQVLEYGTDAETGFSYALVCTFYLDSSQSAISSIKSYSLTVKQDGAYTAAGRYDRSEKKLYFLNGASLPCVLYKFTTEGENAVVYELTKLSCTAANDGSKQHILKPDNSPKYFAAGSESVSADQTVKEYCFFPPAPDAEKRAAVCAATNALGFSGIIPVAFPDESGSEFYGIPYFFDDGFYNTKTNGGSTRLTFSKGNAMPLIDAADAADIVLYYFDYNGGWTYTEVGGFEAACVDMEFYTLLNPLHDAARTEREKDAKRLSQLEFYSPYLTYITFYGKDVRELLKDSFIDEKYLSGRALGDTFTADGYVYTQEGAYIVPSSPQPPSKSYNSTGVLSLRGISAMGEYYVLGTEGFNSCCDSYETVRLLYIDRVGKLAINDGLICGVFINGVPHLFADVNRLNICSVTFYSDGTVADIRPAETPLPVNYEFEIYAFDRLDGGLYVHDLYGCYGGDDCMLGSDIKISMYKSALTGEEGEITFYRADCRLDYYNATYFLEYTTSSDSATPYYINPAPPYLYFTGGCVYSVKNDINGNIYLSVPGSPYETVIPNTNGKYNQTFTSTLFYLPD